MVYHNESIKPIKCPSNDDRLLSNEIFDHRTYQMITNLIQTIDIQENETFLNLDSGYGNILLQMAASLPIKSSIGIERNETLASNAIEIDKHFQLLMKSFGKKCNHYELIRGDFLSDAFATRLKSANVIFVNNREFDVSTHLQPKARLNDIDNNVYI